MTTTAPKIRVPKAKLAAFCQRWEITKLALFGPVVSDDGNFGPESAVDVIARFRLEAHHGLFDLDHMEQELARLLGREINLISWRGLEQSGNRFHQERILGSALVVYAA